jgi:hypothetical protein
MAKKDVFEDKALALVVSTDAGFFEKIKSVTFKFTQSGGQTTLPDTPAEASGGKNYTAQLTLPKVKDDEDKYSLSYKFDALHSPWIGSDKHVVSDGPDSYTVWPETISIKGTKDSDCKVDLEDFPYAIVYPGRGDVSEYTSDDKLAVAEARLRYTGDYTINARSPYYIKDWKKKKGRVQEATVGKMPWTAKIITPVDGKSADAPHKQFVNLSGEGNGSLLEVQVGPTDLALGLKDEEIKVRATFPKKNSKRNKPFSAVWLDAINSGPLKPKTATAKPGVDDLIYETVVKLPADGSPAVFYLQLGFAGGDHCKLEVGVTDTYGDDQLHIENWRQLSYKVLAPAPITTSLGQSALPAETITYMKSKAFDPVFVQFALSEWIDLPELECADFLFSPDYFKCKWREGNKLEKESGLGRQVYVLPPGGRAMGAKFGVVDERTTPIQLADSGFSWTNDTWKTETIEISALDGGAYYHAITKRCLPKTLNDARAGNPSVLTAAKGTDTISKLDDSGVKLKWKAKPPPAKPDHPGRVSSGGAAKEGNLDAWTLEYQDHLTIKITPPGDVVALIGTASDTTCPVEVDVRFLPAHMVGGTSGADGIMLVYTSTAPEAMGATIAHELGHSMGMTILPGRNQTPPGLGAPKHVDDSPPGPYYVDGTPDGSTGIRNIHVGGHCAKGLAVTDLTAAKLNNSNRSLGDGTCIMWGAGGDNNKDKLKKFCEVCTEYLKARNLDNVKKLFTSGARSADDS